MEMLISHCIYSKILEEGIIWKSKRRCARNSEHTVQIQKCQYIKKLMVHQKEAISLVAIVSWLA